jgi:L-rhamnonate dehydratase
MRIANVEAIVVSEPAERIDIDSWDGSQDSVVIRVTTDDGLVGLGEVDSAPEVVRAIVESPPSMRTMWGLRDLLLGEDPREIGRLYEKLYRATSYYGREGCVMHAISGCEIALWDLLGKATGLPVSTLLGGTIRTRVRVYASLMCAAEPAAAAASVTELERDGFTAVKLGGGPLGVDIDHDEAIVRAVRAAAPATELMLDYGQCFETPAEALRVARRLEPHGVTWLEEPLFPDDIGPYVWLAERSPVPIAAGEAESTRSRLDELLRRRAVHVLQPDVTRVGGLGECREVVARARAHGIRCVLHCYNTGITKAASLHLSAVAPNLPLLEYCVEQNRVQTAVTVEQFPVVDGHVAVPVAPGLGVQLDESTIAELARSGETARRA